MPKTAQHDPKAPYEFTLNGTQYTLPSLAKIKSGVIRKVRGLDEVDALFTIIEELADDDTIDAIDALDMDEFEKFCEAWRDWSGVGLGES